MKNFLIFLAIGTFVSCSKTSDNKPVDPPVTPKAFNLTTVTVNGQSGGFQYKGIVVNPSIRFYFDGPVDRSTVNDGLTLKQSNGTPVSYNVSWENKDSVMVVRPASSLEYLAKYQAQIRTSLKSAGGSALTSGSTIDLLTRFDPSDKFPRVSDAQLLTLIQRQHFKYFWDFAHPVSGMARERNTSGDVVTTGGSGFGVMALIVGVQRGFITKAEGLSRMQKIVGFLKNNADKFHGAFPHWMNGATGATVPFSTQDNGADLVETSFLMQGLLTARQYFSGANADEQSLRNDINLLYANVEWDWFRKNNENVLYWHWSPTGNWAMNMQIKGWNECLITYVLAASSTTHGVPKMVYDNGFASNGSMVNGNTYYGVNLPLGPAAGGPLFFAHYSFLGIDPTGLADAYANYQNQNTSHTQINYNHCVQNPGGYYGYSDSCWGLTASDDFQAGYKVHAPLEDNGVISPTAALSSFPYTPTASMKALRFFYYKLGDRLFGQYGFKDAFSLDQPWFADSYLAIDQGPIIIMIENYRSQLLWNLFMSCPEVKNGMRQLGFSGPHL